MEGFKKSSQRRDCSWWAIAAVAIAYLIFLSPSVWAAPPSVGTVTPASGSSPPDQWVTFTATYTDPDGWQDLKNVRLLIDTDPSDKTSSVLLRYRRGVNKLFLRDDTNTVWLGGLPPGTAAILENSQVRLDVAGTTVGGSGNSLTVTWVLSFKPTYSGRTYNTYLLAVDTAPIRTGWIQQGTWTVNRPPTVGSLVPNSGTVPLEEWVTFTATAADPDGWENIALARLLFNTSLTSLNGASFLYNQNENKLFLHNDAGTALLGGIVPGTAVVLENSQVRLDCARTTVNGSGETLSVIWAVSFKSVLSGKGLNSYQFARDDLNARSNWVLSGAITVKRKDETAPTTPVVTDDGSFTTDSTQLHATWTSADPESGVAEYQYAIGTSAGAADVVNWTSTGTTPSVIHAGLSLTPGKRYFFSVKARNGAGTWSAVGSSDGIEVNRPPAVGTITPRSGSSAPDEWVTFTTTFTDPDGWQNLALVRFLANTELLSVNGASLLYNQNENKLYLHNDGATTLLGGFAPGSANLIENAQVRLDCARTTVTGSESTLIITWRIGLKSAFLGKSLNSYLFAKDNFDLAANWVQVGTWAVRDATAPTPPVVTDDGVTTTSATQLHATWTSSDPESGVAEYQYAIGTSAGGTDVVNWTSTGTSPGVTKAGLSLSNGSTYYFTVKAKNGVGIWSAPTASDGILVDSTPPETPRVTDDGAYTTSTSQLHATGTSSDPESGIEEYQYRITQDSPTGLVVVDWTSTGTATEVTRTGLSLAQGETYYFSVKAKNGAGNFSLVGVSDGIQVDPSVPVTPVVTDDGIYTASATQLHAAWSSSDPQSGVAVYRYAIGATPGGTELADWTSVGIATEVTRTGLNLVNGATYYFSVKVKNGAGIWSAVGSSDGIAVDTTPPATPVVTDDGRFTVSMDQLHARWESSSDPESGIVEYRYTIGTTPGGREVANWRSVDLATEVTRFGLILREGETVYVTVQAKNGAGSWSSVGLTDGITVDPTAPSTPVVTDDGFTTVSAGWLHAAWGSSDSVSGIVEYQYRITQDSGAGPVVVDWTSTGTGTQVTQTGLTLTHGTAYFFLVRARNGIGVWSSVGSSDGITVDTVAPVTTANPPGGTFAGTVDVTLSANEPAKIHYTIDDTRPTPLSSVYEAPIKITQHNTLLRFFAVDAVGNQEAVQSVRFEKAPTVITTRIISQDTTWTPTNSPYLIQGSVTVAGTAATPAVLTIEPGVEIQFTRDALNLGRLQISIGGPDLKGALVARGTPEAPIRFTANPKDARPRWLGISFWRATVNELSVMEHCVVEGADENVKVVSSNPTLRNMAIQKGGVGLSIDSSAAPTIQAVMVHDNAWGIAMYHGSSPTITEAIVFSNKRGFYLFGDVAPVITRSTVFANEYGFYLEDESGHPYPAPIVRRSDIYSNSLFNVYAARFQSDGDSVAVDFERNWWGTVDESAIEAGIWHFNDDNKLPLVDYIPYLEEPNFKDGTPPAPPVVTDDGPFTASLTQLHASWVSSDPESEIVEYQYRISQGSPTGAELVAWISAGITTEVTKTELGLVHGGRYYFSVRARNGAGLWSAVGSSDGIRVDATPPTAPVVMDDGKFTISTTELHARWSSSTDPESGVVEYQVAIGTTPGGTDLVNWGSTDLATEVTKTGLSLTDGGITYFSVKAKNGAGSWSSVGTSDGIRVNTKPPVIAAVTPSPDSRFYPPAAIDCRVSATDPSGDPLLYRFLVDGQVLRDWGLESAFSLDSGRLTSGLKTLQMEVKDPLDGEDRRSLQIYLFRRPLWAKE